MDLPDDILFHEILPLVDVSTRFVLRSVNRKFFEILRPNLKEGKNLILHNPLVAFCEKGFIGLVIWDQEGPCHSMLTEEMTDAAASFGDLQLLRYLIQNRKCVISANSLNNACLQGNLAVFKFLLSSGATLSEHALHLAAKKGHFELVRYVIEELRFSVSPIKLQISVAESGNKEFLEYAIRLVSNRIDPEAMGKLAFLGKAALLEHFIGSESNAMLRQCFPAIFVNASSGGHLDIMKLFAKTTKNVDIEDFLMDAAKEAISRGHKEVVKYLVELGLDISDRSLSSAWMTACEKGDYDLITTFLLTDKFPFREIMYTGAISSGNVDLVDLLENLNCPIHALEALSAAIFKKNRLLTQKLIAKCDDNDRISGILNPVLAAASVGDLDLVKQLLDYGFNARYEALDEACVQGHLDIVRHLHEVNHVSISASAIEMMLTAETLHLPVLDYITKNHHARINISCSSGTFTRLLEQRFRYINKPALEMIAELDLDLTGLYESASENGREDIMTWCGKRNKSLVIRKAADRFFKFEWLLPKKDI